MKKMLFTFLTILSPMVTLGHAGHGGHEGTILHYLTSYWHMITILLVVGSVYLLAHSYKRKRYLK